MMKIKVMLQVEISRLNEEKKHCIYTAKIKFHE